MSLSAFVAERAASVVSPLRTLAEQALVEYLREQLGPEIEGKVEIVATGHTAKPLKWVGVPEDKFFFRFRVPSGQKVQARAVVWALWAEEDMTSGQEAIFHVDFERTDFWWDGASLSIAGLAELLDRVL